MKFRSSDVEVMFIIITFIRTIIYIYIYIGRILHRSTVSVGLAQARPNNHDLMLELKIVPVTWFGVADIYTI